MNFEDLKNPELQEKLKTAKTIEELAAIAAAEGVDLGSDVLRGIAGGWCNNCRTYCPEECWDDNS